MDKVKPYVIDKRLVVDAWRHVKANRGSAGVDNVSVQGYERELENNLYKLWNRMSSGSYFPKPVKIVEIPKTDGKTRRLGIPTIEDRVAQMVVKQRLEPEIEPYFHPDSYGYRAGKNAHQAIAKTRARCWRMDWVIDLDIKGFFDNLDHDLIMKALRRHTDEHWIHLYVRRWLEAPEAATGKQGEKRIKGTPQGGVISPLLANLYMHYAFDAWMSRTFPQIKFARYADDVVIHAVSEAQANYLLEKVRKRMKTCGLALHPDKTKIVYCQDGKRKKQYKDTSFDFLGYSFTKRSAKGRYGLFMSFLPAISAKATQAIRKSIRGWRLSSMEHLTLDDVAQMINPKVRGWLNYYGRYYLSELWKSINLIVQALVRWATRKYKSLKRKPKQARAWLAEIANRDPELFVHWSFKS